jgi:hypothetical protein
MHAFIVRPFDTKEGIDFNRVEAELIDPVLTRLGIRGRTTAEIARAGNIRTDMFELLYVADVVIADISIDNANVYYELGVRHALRDRVTVLIRAAAHDVPFDLRTDRYLAYDAKNPGATVDDLCRTIEQSQLNEGKDSPVFALLPRLRPTDPEEFRPVPRGFCEEVQAASDKADLPKLAVLADEASEAGWQLGGLQAVASAQFNLQAWPDARATFEAIRQLRPNDPDANLKLGTVLQRLGDPAESSVAMKRVIDRGDLSPNQRAEAWALHGSNGKTRWTADWRDESPERRPAAALRSACLDEARDAYDKGFLSDQNHWYPGVNALALLIVTLHLAKLEPDVWAERFEDEDKATSALKDLEAERDDLAGAVRRSLMASEFKSTTYDVWSDLTKADLTLLTTTRPTFAAQAYRRARARAAEAAERFPARAAARQLQLYIDLGVLTENAKAALEALDLSPEPAVAPDAPRTRTIVFSGHRIDAPDREQPRFPPIPEAEEKATELIRAAIEEEKRRAGNGPINGIAGGASGGDIIFHEQCAALGIPTELLLALPRDAFAAASVADAGPNWVDRYRALWQRLDVKVLSQTEALPDWLAVRDDYSIWQRNNRWILHSATSRADTDVSLIVLWDGKGGDGPGGTQDMVELGGKRGVRFVRLDATKLLA